MMVINPTVQRQQAKDIDRIQEESRKERLTIIVGAGVSINVISTSQPLNEEDCTYISESLSWLELLHHGDYVAGTPLDEAK